MAASDSLNPRLFHGTGGDPLEGGVIKPGYINVHGVGAYATDNLEAAEFYAKIRAGMNGQLFGTVFEVEPTSNAKTVKTIGPRGILHNEVIDPKGLRVKGVISYPIFKPTPINRPPGYEDDD